MHGCQPTRRGVSILIRVERFKAPACGGAPLPHVPKLRETIRLGLAGRVDGPARRGHAQRGCRSPRRTVGCAATQVVPGTTQVAQRNTRLRRMRRAHRLPARPAGPNTGSRQLELKGEPSCRPPAPSTRAGRPEWCKLALAKCHVDVRDAAGQMIGSAAGNSGILIATGIETALKLIASNPIGFPVAAKRIGDGSSAEK